MNGCASSSESGTITVNPTPSVVVNDMTICAGENALLTALPSDAGGTYLWSPGSETTASITLSPSSTSSYSVVYTLNGCPSATEIGTITVLNTPDVTVTTSGNSIIAIQVGASYQWLDCDNNDDPIIGATNQSFTPNATGNYSVILDLGGCLDTSTCVLITIVGLNELSQNDMYVYPNPVSDELMIQSSESLINVMYQIIDSGGKLTMSGYFVEDGTINVTLLPVGNYTLRVDDGQKGNIQFVKK